MGLVTGSRNEHGFRGAVCSCGRDIAWALTDAGRPMPLEARPVVTFVPTGEGRVEARRAYLPHWPNCPDAQRYRKRGRTS